MGVAWVFSSHEASFVHDAFWLVALVLTLAAPVWAGLVGVAHNERCPHRPVIARLNVSPSAELGTGCDPDIKCIFCNAYR